MVTSKPFSTISYNEPLTLHTKLSYWIDHQILDFFMYIWHKPEDDEEKGHFHVYMVPSSKVNATQLLHELVEFIPGEKLPRKCRPPTPSKFQDWFLYDIHYPPYLAAKGQTRKYHYSKEDIICSDDTFLTDQIQQIDWTKINPLGDVITAAKSGISFSEFLEKSNMSLLQVRAAQFVFEQVQGGKFDSTNRNDRLTHTPLNDKLSL